MSLNLDSRQRAMLQEMGVRVWLPADAAVSEAPEVTPALPVAVAATSQASRNDIESIAAYAVNTGATTKFGLNKSATPVAEEVLAGAGELAADVASLDWPALTQTLKACQACALCSGRRTAVVAAPDAPLRADWLVISEPPDDVDEQAGAPLAGAAGQLFDNMLNALALSRHAGSDGLAAAAASAAYVTSVVKCRPAQPRNPTLAELAVCEHYLRREVALVQPKVILALGRFAAQGLLQGSVPDLASIPLGQLRGQPYRYQGVPVIVSYPPSYLLRSPQHKARAWVDLCRALDARRRGG